MKIAFVSADTGGCRHYRQDLPGSHLHSSGGHRVLIRCKEVYVAPSGEMCVVNSAGDVEGGFDLIVLQRWMADNAADTIRRARALGQAVVNDVDDWFFGIPTSNLGWGATHVRSDPLHNVNHYRKALAASSAITVSTPYLAERLAPLGRPVHVLRNAIDLQRWSAEPRERGGLTLGWLGHIDYRAPGDLAQLRGWLGPWMSRHPEARFLHLGARNQADEGFAEAVGIDPEHLDSRVFVPLRALPNALARFDIGLAPLERCPFNESKSAIKSIEMSAAGVAHVCSDLPEYEAFGGAFALASKASDWMDALDALTDPAVRVAGGLNARKTAETQDIAHRWIEWERTYLEIVSDAMRESVRTPVAPTREIVRFKHRRAKVKRS